MSASKRIEKAMEAEVQHRMRGSLSGEAVGTGSQPPSSSGPGSAAKKPRLVPGDAGAAASKARDSPMQKADEAEGELQLLSEEEKTPSQQQPNTPRAPAAPTKSGSSFNRSQPSPAVRSLTPIFNGCTNAAERARQMGGQYTIRRRPQQAQGGAGFSGNGDSPPVTSVPKRSRSVLGELLQSPSAFLGRRSTAQPLNPAGATMALKVYAPPKGGAAETDAAVPAAHGATPPSPAPTPLSLQVGPVTTTLFAAEREADVTAAAAAAMPLAHALAGLEGRIIGRPLQPQQQAKRPLGRPVGVVQQQEEDGGRSGVAGWLKSAAFKPR